MSKFPRIIIRSSLAAALLALTLWLFWHFAVMREYRLYERITPGLTLAEVEALLGPGERREQEVVPSISVAVILPGLDLEAERAAIIEQDRLDHLAGRPPRTVKSQTWRNGQPKTYRARHVVEGELIYRWTFRGDGQEVWIAFQAGVVTEKYYFRRSL